MISTVLKIVLIISILVNLVAVWGFFHYIRYGGSPLGELKRKLTGTVRPSTVQVDQKSENTRLLGETSAGEEDSLRVVFFGASITERWDLARAFPEIHALNRGNGGEVIYQLLPRFKQDVLDLRPKAVVIKFCSVNIRPNIPARSLMDGMVMFCQLASANNITPIPATIIPAGRPEAHIGDFSVVDSLRAFNIWLRQYAHDHDYPLMDFAKALEDKDGFLPREWSADPVHLNAQGYEIIAGVARPVLLRALALSATSTATQTP